MVLDISTMTTPTKIIIGGSVMGILAIIGIGYFKLRKLGRGEQKMGTIQGDVVIPKEQPKVQEKQDMTMVIPQDLNSMPLPERSSENVLSTEDYELFSMMKEEMKEKMEAKRKSRLLIEKKKQLMALTAEIAELEGNIEVDNEEETVKKVKKVKIKPKKKDIQEVDDDILFDTEED